MICTIVKYDISDEICQTRLQLLTSIIKAERDLHRLIENKSKKK